MTRPAPDRDRKSTVDPAWVEDPDRLFAAFRSSRSAELASRIYAMTAGRLRLCAAALLNDPNDVDDAVHDTFLAAFERPEGWDPDRPLLPWLAGILRNRVLNQSRSERRRKVREALRTSEPTGSAALDELGAVEVLRAVEDGIKGLPPHYRTIVSQRVLDGATSAEIARGLGRTESTVRVQLSRGLRMLRDALPLGIGAAVAVALTPGRAFAAMRTTPNRPTPGRPPVRTARWPRPVIAGVAVGVPLVSIAVLALLRLGGGSPLPGPAEPSGAAAPIATGAFEPVGPVGVAAARTSVSVPTRAGIVVALQLDGRPAAGAPVSIDRIDDASLFVTEIVDHFGTRTEFELPGGAVRHARPERTDAGGLLRFEPAPGRYLVRVPGGGAVVEVGPGDERRLGFELHERAVAVSGRVFDADGRPCEAEIWCTRDAGARTTEPLATAVGGRFQAVLPRGACVVARSRLGVSAATVADPGAGELRLELARAGDLRGTVRGTDGHALADAIVEVLAGEFPGRTRTDASGRFELAGVPAGPCTVLARSRRGDGHGSAAAAVRPGETTSVDLELVACSTVEGRVTDDGGHPVARTRVRVGWSTDQLDDASAVTDEDGRFTLAGVPPRRVRLTAGLGSDGFAEASFEPAPGEVIVWEPVLSTGDLCIAGRVEIPAGAPPLVIALDSIDHLRPQVQSLRDGSFAFTVPPMQVDRAFTARIYRADSLTRDGRPTEFPIAVFPAVRPGERNLRWRVSAELAPRGALRARVAVPAGRYSGQVRLQQAGLRQWIPLGQLDAATTAIEVRADHLAVGRYAIVLDRDLDRVEFELAAGEQIDLGDVPLLGDERRTARRVTVVLVFEHPGDATRMDRLECEVLDADGRPVARVGVPGDRGEWRARVDLPQGPVRVRAWTAGGLRGEAAPVVCAADGGVVRIPLQPAAAKR